VVGNIWQIQLNVINLSHEIFLIKTLLFEGDTCFITKCYLHEDDIDTYMLSLLYSTLIITMTTIPIGVEANFLVRFHANTQHILLFYFCCYCRSRRWGCSRRFCSSWKLVVCLDNIQILLLIIIRRAILAPSVIFVCGCAYIM
jgi:hypothetical protein